jgi:hypothetical protein
MRPPPPAVHLAADAGVQAYKQPYPRVETDGSHRVAFIPGRAVVHVVGTQGAWAQVMIDGDVVGWVEGSQLIPPIGTPIMPPRNQVAAAPSNPTAINVDSLVAVLASIGIIMGAVLDWTQGIAVNSFKIPAAFLLDAHTTSHQPRIGHVVVALGVLGVLLSFARGARPWRGLVGVVALGVSVLYCAQIAVQLSDVHSSTSFTDVVGAGPWLTGIAGLALLVSAFLAPAV